MSSVATAAPDTGQFARAVRLPVSPDVALGVALAAVLALLAFVTTGGVNDGPNTWAEIVVTVVGAGLAAAVLMYSAPARLWGGVTLLLFVALTVLTAVSIAWSVQPADSWIEANRALSYLAAFTGAMALGRLFPERWAGVVGGIALLATVLCGYALLAKVFPAAFDRADQVGRISAPFDYWNASGLIAALGLPACLWCGARREGSRALRVLTAPAVAILVTVLILSYSRSALLAAVLGLIMWFAVVPLRLRATAILAVGSAGGAVATAWALSTRPFTHDQTSLHDRVVAGHGFGLVLVPVLILTAIAGAATVFALDRVQVRDHARRQIGIALIGLAALIPVGALASLATSSRGFTGEVSHIWSSLTSTHNSVGDNPGRLVELGNSRPRYWREGIKVGEHALLAGVGAGGYATARTRYTTDPWVVGHAHSYLFETFADLGLLGVGLSLALLVSWSLAAARAAGSPLAVKRADRAPPSGNRSAGAPERLAILTLIVVVVVFGIHSMIDWTWFIPGAAVPALVCAGWLAGRGPLEAPVGRLRRRRTLTGSPAVGAAVVALAAAALLGAWAIWQPLRSDNAQSAAITALTHGNARQALADAQTAASRNPLSVDPLFLLSEIYTATGNQSAAHDELVQATALQPDNALTWETLGEYDVQHNQPLRALPVLRIAAQLDRGSRRIHRELAELRAELR